jgi:hypothetical protein
MSITQILHEFAADKQLNTVALLVAADVIFGVGAALKAGTFQVSYLVQFLHDDILAKVAPWLAVFAFSKVDHGTIIGGYGTFGDISTVLFAGITAALVASIVKSLGDLGLPVPTKALALAGGNPFKGVRSSYLFVDGDDSQVASEPPKVA